MNKTILSIAICAAAFFTIAANAQSQAKKPSSATTFPVLQITRAGEQASMPALVEYFTGQARVDPRFTVNESRPIAGAYVTFEPGARTAWHTHPLGQTLVVTAGVGMTQEWGKSVQIIRPGDVIWIPPDIKHWHGAAPETAMTHLAITGAVDGKSVTWMEKVNDEQYKGH